MRNRFAGLMMLMVLMATAAQAAGKVTPAEKQALAKLACKDLGAGKSLARFDCHSKSAAQIIREIDFQTIDLNGDGKAEFQLSVSAEAVKRVNIAIYQKMPQGYRLLFKGLSKGVEVKKLRTNGYRDLEEMDAGAGVFYVTYKYDGRKYQEHDCWMEEVNARGKTLRKRCRDSEQ